MKIASVRTCRSDNVIDQLKDINNLLNSLGNLDDEISFDMSELLWLSPLHITVLSILTQTKNGFILPRNLRIKSYLATLNFPFGESLTINNTSKTYLPLCFLRQDLTEVSKDRIISVFADYIFKICGFREGSKDALNFPICEIANNMVEYSNASLPYIFAQKYNTKGFVDIVVADNGQGISQSYKSGIGLDLTHAEALEKTMAGVSSSGDPDRGRGLRRTRELVVEKLGGEFLLLSGGAAVYSSNQDTNIYEGLAQWSGTIVLMRLPVVIPEGIDISSVWE